MLKINQTLSPGDVNLSEAGLEAVSQALKSYIASGKLPGFVTLVARHGHVVHEAVSGFKNLTSGEPLTLDTIFRAFSMTKPITASAMMILRDRGMWSPSDPIAKHLPEFKDITVYAGLGSDGRVLTKAADHAPTMAELMSMRAGLAYALGGGTLEDADVPYYRNISLADSPDANSFVKRIASLPLASQPGTRWRYSWAVDVQGAIIERLTGQTLPDFYRENLFEPLGMDDTTFFVPADKRHRLAQLYQKIDDAPLEGIDNLFFPETCSEPSFPWAGAGLFTTARDYARFAQLLLNKGNWAGRQIVSQASVAEQMTNLLPAEMLEDKFTLGQHRFRPGYGYGYNGVVVTDPIAADLPVGEGSYFWDGAAGTWFWVDPVNDLIFVGMVQVISETNPPFQEITQRLIADAILP